MLAWILLSIALLISLLIWGIAMSSLIGFLRVRVPLVYTRRKDFLALLKYLEISPGTVFYELGSGGGNNSFFTERFTPAVVTGFELVWWSFLFSLVRKFLRKSKAKFVREDFFKVSWAAADLLYCYLLPQIMPAVSEKFFAEAKPGAKLISYDFPIKNLTPLSTYQTGSNHTFYIYQA